KNYNTEEDARWYETSSNWPQDPHRAAKVVERLISLKRQGVPIANSYAQLEAMAPYFLDPAAFRLTVQNHSAHEARRLCSALTNLEVRAGGDVFTCARMEPIGNVMDQPIRQIWESRP